MPDDLQALMPLLVAALCMGLGAFVQGSIGFGFGIVSLSLMGVLLDIDKAAVMIAPAGLALNVSLVWRLRKHFSFSRVKGVLIGVIVGAPLGVYFLSRAGVAFDVSVLQLVLGLVLIAAVVQGSIKQLDRHRWHPWFLGLPCGLFSGFLTGTLGTGGPPLVAYVRAQRFDRLRYAATVQVLLGVAGVVRVEELARQDLFTRQLLVFAAAGVVTAWVGSVFGVRLLRKLPEKRLRQIVAAFLLFMGFVYITRYLLS